MKTKKHPKVDPKPAKTALEEENEEVAELIRRIEEEVPEEGTQTTSNGTLRFDAMPISKATLRSLTAANLTIATDIQAAALPHALAGRDILGAAKTGSGKTLAFVIPLIEKLFRERWSDEDGLAAIIITPTRELALQIFEVIRVVGRGHQLSAGLVTGGKKEFQGEQERVIKMNILVATPGRLLQHLEQTPDFDASKLQMLVLDEADRILDMGFKQQLDSILQFLPRRQTLLFSATQTKSVKDLARLSLKDAQYLAVHAESEEVTPSQLVQNYVVCKLDNKLDILFSFIKSHLKSKIVVFFSTCSQVRFVHECFRGMQPGIPLTALHGKIKQERRTIIYMDYSRRKAACLFATDIAARGLDFPDVDWVIQVDAPEDAAMYIHRVGRTARYKSSGRALMLLLPNEERHVIDQLSTAGVPIKKLTVNPKYTVSVASHAAALLVAQPECRILAKKAFVGYLRSLQLMPSGESDPLDLSTLRVDEFAASLGLAYTPEVPVVPKGNAGRAEIRSEKNINWSLDKLKKQIKAAKEEKKRAKLLAAGGGEVATTGASSSAGDDDDALFVVKQVHDWSGNGDVSGDEKEGDVDDVAEALKKKKSRLKIKSEGSIKVMREAGAKKTLFDESGDAVAPLQLVDKTARAKKRLNEESELVENELAVKMSEHTRKVKARIDEGRLEDADRDAKRVRAKHREIRIKGKAERESESDLGGVVLSHPDVEHDELGDNEDTDDDGSQESDTDIKNQELLALRMLNK